MTGTRDKTAFAGEGEKARMEADEVALVFGNRGGHVVELLLPAALCGLGRARAVECGAQA